MALLPCLKTLEWVTDMTRSITGARWEHYVTSSHDDLSSALEEATNTVAGLERIYPGSYIRIVQQFDVETAEHDIFIVVETS